MSKAITCAPAIRANSIVPNPIGPAPITKTYSLGSTAALRTPCAPIANGSTKANSSKLNPSPCSKDEEGTDKYSTMPPSTCTPQTCILVQQFGLPLRQAMHSPQLK